MTRPDSSIRDRVEAVMRGHENPGAWGAPLFVAEKVYGLGVKARNALYDLHVLKPQEAPCKIISVGNLTVGGTGKTPFVMLMAEKLRATAPDNWSFGILSRGYGGKAASGVHVVCDGSALGAGPPVSADEPYMLARKLGVVPVVCAPKRIEGAVELVERFKVDAIIMDDGFQHRAISRDLNILLVDALNPFGNGHLFPRGVLREHVSGIKRADLVVISGASGLGEGERGELTARIGELAREDVDIIAVEGQITGFEDMEANPAPPPDAPVYAFCAVANPDYFKDSLEKMNIKLAGFRAFGDHHWFSDEEIERIRADAVGCQASAIVTTQKDAVRLIDRYKKLGLPLKIAVWKMEITEGGEKLDLAISEIIS
ncbi:Tetraacyldisaccharide 4'-kinase [hydrothermal vent metagenome]|uniref:tetraacyldisaccharide 4'-kinase n=1 Tax=hydrothermal vent metagenome TaxID=652676 RepID=A0A3B1C3W0_9ZZZZ